MTKNEIIKLAREAGFEGMTDHPALMRFANLIAAHKTEIALAEAYRCGHEAGVVAEREACAKVCDDLDDDIVDGLAGWQYGEAIRARGTK